MLSMYFDRKCLPGDFLTRLAMFISHFAKAFRKIVFQISYKRGMSRTLNIYGRAPCNVR